MNLKYAINGTGKSTIAKAVTNANDSDELKQLIPFKYKNDNKHLPKVVGVPENFNVVVFDESYVSQYEFQQDELIKNSFEIFIKTEEFLKLQEEIDELIKETKSLFQNNSDIIELLSIINGFCDSFRATKKGFSASGPLGKGLAKGNKINNIPNGLEVYKPYIQNENNVSWLSWQLKGKEFLEIANSCPYCSTGDILDKKELIEKVSKEYEPKYVEHLEKVLKLLTSLENFLTNSAREKIKEIKKNVSGISDEQSTFLVNIYKQIDTLKQKLEKLNNLSYYQFKDVHNVTEVLKDYRIDLSFLPDLNSDKTTERVKKINIVIDSLLNRAKSLNIAIGKEKRIIADRIQNSQCEINDFMEYAGYSYKVVIENIDDDYKLKLFHKDCEDNFISGKNELSYGERNAFALVLFMYDVLSKNPDLIILDDPISSFDGNKKFAILYRLFSESKNSLKDKTVLMLTHEFSSVIDIVKTLNRRFKANASFLYNKNGILNEKPILADDILSFKQVMYQNIDILLGDINKCAYLRRYLEYENMTDDFGYDVLSNLFHKRDKMIKYQNKKEMEMSKREIDLGVDAIREFIPNFDYMTFLRIVKDNEKMIALYKKSNSGYEKLQIYRIIFDNDKREQSVVAKFINETFHIENDYLFQLNPCKYEIIPTYILKNCDERIRVLENEILQRI